MPVNFSIQILHIECGSINSHWEDNVENWKKAVIAGSAAAATVMVIKGKNSAGLLLAGVSLAALASEYPREFARFRRRLPDYIERGAEFVETASLLGERLADGRGNDWFGILLRG
jgi:hypothetical protein